MTKSFEDRLKNLIRSKRTNICLGIDPGLHMLPPGLRPVHSLEPGERLSRSDQKVWLDTVERWATDLLDTAAGRVPAVKLQSAYFESLGAAGTDILERLCQYAAKHYREELLVIQDCKRGDISTTMQAYGKAVFDVQRADVMTVNPYMGIDTVKALEPWLKAGFGAYVVNFPSNVSAHPLMCAHARSSAASQDQQGGERSSQTVYGMYAEAFLKESAEQSFSHGLGFVVGASSLNQVPVDHPLLKRPLLIPGVGAQGGQLKDMLVSDRFDKSKDLLPMSRGLTGYRFFEDANSLEQVDRWQDYVDAFQRHLDQTVAQSQFIHDA